MMIVQPEQVTEGRFADAQAKAFEKRATRATALRAWSRSHCDDLPWCTQEHR